jgi:hypothetical protein
VEGDATYDVTVDRATGADDMAGVDVMEGATDAAGIPILRLGGAADVETIVAAGCAVAVVGAAVKAEVPKLRLAVGAEPKAATVDVAGKENPPIAGADVVVAEGFKPKLNPPVGAVGAGAVAVAAAGAPNPNPADAVVVVVLPSPRLRVGAADEAGAPNESGLAAGAARAVVAGTVAPRVPATVAAGAPPNEKDVAPPTGAAPPNGATPTVGNDPPNPNDGALAVLVTGATEAEAGAMGLPNETPDEGAATAAGAPKAGAAPVAGAPKAGVAVAGAPNAGAGAAPVAGAPNENPELVGAG